MPIYFLHVMDGDEVIPDPEDIERHTFAAVQRDALEGASDLMTDAVKRYLTVVFARPVMSE